MEGSGRKDTYKPTRDLSEVYELRLYKTTISKLVVLHPPPPHRARDAQAAHLRYAIVPGVRRPPRECVQPPSVDCTAPRCRWARRPLSRPAPGGDQRQRRIDGGLVARLPQDAAAH